MCSSREQLVSYCANVAEWLYCHHHHRFCDITSSLSPRAMLSFLVLTAFLWLRRRKMVLVVNSASAHTADIVDRY